MKIISLIFLAFLFMGCTAAPAGPPEIVPAVSTQQPALNAPVSEDNYEIYAWVDRPEPKLDEIVTVSGSLVKNGAHLGGIGMWMFWPAEDGGPVSHDCVSYMMYQRGICQIIVKDYAPGQFVPVKIRVEYHDQVFTTETGFTPREN